MQYSVTPRNQRSFSCLPTKERMEAMKTEIRLLAYRIKNAFARTEIIDVTTTCAVMRISSKKQADIIAKKYDCHVAPDILVDATQSS